MRAEVLNMFFFKYLLLQASLAPRIAFRLTREEKEKLLLAAAAAPPKGGGLDGVSLFFLLSLPAFLPPSLHPSQCCVGHTLTLPPLLPSLPSFSPLPPPTTGTGSSASSCIPTATSFSTP